MRYNLSRMTPTTIGWLKDNVSREDVSSELISRLQEFLSGDSVFPADLDSIYSTAVELYAAGIVGAISIGDIVNVISNAPVERSNAFKNGLPSSLREEIDNIVEINTLIAKEATFSDDANHVQESPMTMGLGVRLVSKVRSTFSSRDHNVFYGGPSTQAQIASHKISSKDLKRLRGAIRGYYISTGNHGKLQVADPAVPSHVNVSDLKYSVVMISLVNRGVVEHNILDVGGYEGALDLPSDKFAREVRLSSSPSAATTTESGR